MRRGKRQSDLAAELGLTSQQLSDRLSGRTPWRLAGLWGAADFLGIPLATLVAAAERTETAVPA